MLLKGLLTCTFTYNTFCQMQLIEKSPNIQLTNISAYTVVSWRPTLKRGSGEAVYKSLALLEC